MAGPVAAIVVAAGRGLRAGGDRPKQYATIAGEPVVRPSLAVFADHAGIDVVLPVIHPDDAAMFAGATAGLDLLAPVHGGTTRQASVCNGLEALASHKPAVVLVHDAARPFTSPELISRAIDAGATHGAGIPAVLISDTVKLVDEAGRVTETLDRARLRTVQTPQAFAYPALLDAHRKAKAAGRQDFTDDAALAEWAGMPVTVFAGETSNTKLTTPEDIARATMRSAEALTDIRIGTGYDVHAFEDGDHVTLGGVRIPHERRLSGHSDADVALHALVDAILGTLADGDIGVHFPPSDEKWRGASSDKFLAFAVERVRARGGMIAHLDIAMICETPRIGPHRDAMRARIAEVAGVSIDRVAIKATTNEKLGFIGRSEGLAAIATATIRLPWGP